MAARSTGLYHHITLVIWCVELTLTSIRRLVVPVLGIFLCSQRRKHCSY